MGWHRAWRYTTRRTLVTLEADLLPIVERVTTPLSSQALLFFLGSIPISMVLALTTSSTVTGWLDWLAKLGFSYEMFLLFVFIDSEVKDNLPHLTTHVIFMSLASNRILKLFPSFWPLFASNTKEYVVFKCFVTSFNWTIVYSTMIRIMLQRLA